MLCNSWMELEDKNCQVLLMESGSRDEKQQEMAEIKSIAFQNPSVGGSAVKSG